MFVSAVETLSPSFMELILSTVRFAQMNPLLAELLASRKAPTTASDLFNRKSASSLWIKESVESALPPVKVPRLDDDEIDSDDDQEEGAYDVRQPDLSLSQVY